MTGKRRRKDPLHDGSVGSYVFRFLICFLLGIFLDGILIAGIWALWYTRFDTVFLLWPLWVAIPPVMGIGGHYCPVVEVQNADNSLEANTLRDK
jgi:hypothetical protein